MTGLWKNRNWDELWHSIENASDQFPIVNGGNVSKKFKSFLNMNMICKL